MRIKVMNTAAGLVPLYDEDWDARRKLRIGETYVAEVKVARNVAFHRKYFKLLTTAWEMLGEERQAFFNDDKECFRKTVEVAAGHSERIWDVRGARWVDIPKSIAFGKMDDTAFDDLYGRVMDVLLMTFLTDMTKEDMEKLMTFV